MLVHESADGCVYQFEWYTAAACPMSHQHGKDCAVVDAQAGGCQFIYLLKAYTVIALSVYLFIEGL